MIKALKGEIWKQMQFDGYKKLRKKYAVSSLGRMASYEQNVLKDGKIIGGSVTMGYQTLNLRIGEKTSTIYIHREVASNFCKKTSSKHKFVIHKNHKKKDNGTKNLRWVTAEELSSHQQKSPEKIAYKQKQANRKVGLKLKAADVKAIKQILKSPNRKITYSQLAIKYNITPMTLYRIKRGENWGKIK